MKLRQGKVKKPKKYGDTKRVKRFAIFPTKMSNGTWILWGFYWALKRWEDMSTLQPDKWATYHKEEIFTYTNI